MIWYVLPILMVIISTLVPPSRFLVEPIGLHLAFTEHQYEISIAWSSALPLLDSTVYIREIECGNSIETSDWTEFEPVWNWNFKRSAKTWEVVYKVLVTGVFPECGYEYTVGAGVIWSPIRRFAIRTPYDPLIPARDDMNHVTNFIVFGDLGIGHRSAPSRNLMFDFITTKHIDGILHMGDIAYDLESNNPGIARTYFSEMEPITSRVPYMVLPGNHETFFNYTQYIEYFRMPVNQANGGLNKFYSFDHGRAHFLLYSSDTLLSGEPEERDRHMQWIKDDLMLANQRRDIVQWLIVLAHKPYYCQVDYTQSLDPDTGLEDNWDCTFRAERIREMMEELFFSEGVDLVLNGHVHNYQRSTPLYHNQTVPSAYDDQHFHINAAAPVFIVSGAPGNTEGNDPMTATPQLWCAMQTNELGFGQLKVMNSTHLYWEQWSSINKTVIDYLWLVKNRDRY